MNRNKNTTKEKNYRGKGERRNSHNADRRDGKSDYKKKEKDAKLEAEARPNDPNYYFLDRGVADQVSQLSFQTLGGVDRYLGSQPIAYPNIKAHFWNPSAGVQPSVNPPQQLQQTGINMAGLRLFTKLSAYTGRQATYGPQDISTMILDMGEIISCMEWVRRAFGVAFLGSEQNRTYPLMLLNAMKIDGSDFYANYSQYRNRFNKLVTLVNQLPIPQSCAYFDKCAHMYEKVYLDAPSPLATVIVDNPLTTWILDETSYSGGSILATTYWCGTVTTGDVSAVNTLSYYLVQLERMVNALLNSSTLQVVYTDLLNLASKMDVKFWKLDYLNEGYLVIPEYNAFYLLQMHNSTITGVPAIPTYIAGSSETPWNDVYPNAGNNALFYNPGFKPWYTTSGGDNVGPMPARVILDSINAQPSVEDRIEMIRWTSLSSGDAATIGGVEYVIDTVLADHYITKVQYFRGNTARVTESSSFRTEGNANIEWAALATKVDWNALVYVFDTNSDLPTGDVIGDLNYYTVIDYDWLRPIFDFTALALYEFR